MSHSLTRDVPRVTEPRNTSLLMAAVSPDTLYEELGTSITSSPTLGDLIVSPTITRSGVYKMTFSLLQITTAGSPFFLTVSPGAVSAATTFPFGSGLRGAVMGTPSTISVSPRDKFGNEALRQAIAGLSAQVRLV